VVPAGQAAPIAAAFFSSIAKDQQAKSPFSEEDRTLLQGIFNTRQCDRRGEGNLFAPPDTNLAYVDKLRVLLHGEALVRQQRKEHFLSSAFAMDRAGSLFPSSWTSSIEIQGQELRSCPESGTLRLVSGCKPALEALKSANLVFDKSTEDGSRFRIYRPGSIEVRTIQEPTGEESIAAVFSVQAEQLAKMEGQQLPMAKGAEKVVKATVYVERTKAARGYYLVIESEQGRSIVTEMLQDGSVTFEARPGELEVRNSLAKVFCTACLSEGVTVGAVEDFRTAETRRGVASASRRKRYALSAYCRAGGKAMDPLGGLKVLRQGKSASIVHE